MTEPMAQTERRLMAMESTQFVEPGASVQKLLSSTQRELEDARRQNKNLTSQVESLQAKIKEERSQANISDLESAPHRDAPPDKHNFVERYNEMKGSLSSLTSVLAEMNESNRSLTARIVELESRVKAEKEEKEKLLLLDRQASIETHSQAQRSSMAMVSTQLAESNAHNLALEQEIGELKGKQEAAEKQQEMQNTMPTIDQPELDDARRLNEELKAEVEDLQKRYTGLVEERGVIIQKQEAMEKDVQESRDALASARDEAEKAHAREDVLQSKYDFCYSELESLREASNTQYNSMKTDLPAFQKELEDEKHCNGVLKDLIGKLNHMNDDLEEKHRKKAEENKFLRTQNRNFTHSIEKLQKLSEERDHADVTKENVALLEECKFLRSQKRGFANSITKLENQLAQIVREKEAVVAEEKKLSMRIDALALANEQLQNTMKTIESQNFKKLDAAMNRNKWLDGQLVKAQKAIMDLASKTKSLRQALSSDLDESNEREIRMTKEVMTQRAQAQAVEVKLKERDKEFEELEEDLEAIRQEAQNMIEDLRSQVEALKSRTDELIAERDAVQTERESLETSLVEQTDSVEELRRETESYHERDEQLKKDVGSMFGEW
jgi:chromosome segregation ATPase